MIHLFATDDGATLVRLLLSHLLTDFFLQPDRWVAHKRTYRHRSTFLYWHCAIAGGLAWLLAGQWSAGWWLVPFVGLTHFGIDWLKLTHGNARPLRSFLLDQAAHLLVLLLAWLLLIDGWADAGRGFRLIMSDLPTLAILAGYLVCTTPLSVVIGIATRHWLADLNTGQSDEANTSLANAGRWIGIAERTLIFTFVVIGQYEAIGFLLAAKSLLRFREAQAVKQSEYVLIGTLLSYGLAILIGLAVRLTL